MTRVARKWRPSLALVVALVCAVLIVLPLTLVMVLQIGTNRFVRETEKALLQQAAIYAAAYAESFEAETREKGDASTPGYFLPPKTRVFWSARARTFAPFVDLRSDDLAAPAPDPVPVETLLDERYRAMTPGLATLAERAHAATLTSVRFLDFQGLDIESGAPVLSHAALPEVQKALTAGIGIGVRQSEGADGLSVLKHALGAGYRVFLAYPVISDNRVIGAVLLSRTPPSLVTYFEEERPALLTLAAVTLAGAVLVGALLVLVLLRPIAALQDQSRLVAEGMHESLIPLRHYGLHEIAELGQSILSMSESLAGRAKEIGIYTNHVTHELKTPVTTIAAAVELLSEYDLPDETRAELTETVAAETARMNRLLEALRDMSRARQGAPGTPAPVGEMLPDLPGLTVAVDDPTARLPLSVQHGQAVFTQLLRNAKEHGATRADISWNGNVLRIADNGRGFGETDLGQLADPFFTTRRESGGTGMGLAIVVALLALYGANLTPIRTEAGAVFEIRFTK